MLVLIRVMSPTRKPSKLRAARKSRTVHFAALVPAILAVAEATKDQLPAISSLLSGWPLVALSVAVSAVVAILRVRNEGGTDAG